MLKGLYQVDRMAVEEGRLTATVAFNPEHAVYKAHFPGNPVTPGACLLKTAVELLEKHCGKRLQLKSASHVKFLQVVDPRVSPKINFTFTIEQSGVLWSAAIGVTDGAATFAKFSLTCREVTRFDKVQATILIPTYNNEKSLAALLDACLGLTDRIVAVNDGSTDATAQILAGYHAKITVVQYEKNRGKAYALKQGFKKVCALGSHYALTMDSDGQHLPEEVEKLVAAIEESPGALIVGSRLLEQENMPSRNTFANRFSNFWFRVQTWKKLPDTQSGLRAYPLHKMNRLSPVTNRYEGELELLVRAAWRGIPLRALPVEVYYPPEEERVTHFRPTVDFVRISLLNTCLCLLAVVYGYPRMLCSKLLRK